MVSEAQFNQMFPSRNSFYTYSGLTAALSAYPGFANTGSDTVKKQEAAAFLANVNHETGGLVYVVEQNTANYPHYCDPSQPYGCPAGPGRLLRPRPDPAQLELQLQGRGRRAGHRPADTTLLVQTDAAVAWKTGLWYWNTQTGPGTMTPHNAMVNGAGFGETIRSINGSIECNGRNPAQVQSRVNAYQQFTSASSVCRRRQPVLLNPPPRVRLVKSEGDGVHPRHVVSPARPHPRAAGSRPGQTTQRP